MWNQHLNFLTQKAQIEDDRYCMYLCVCMHDKESFDVVGGRKFIVQFFDHLLRTGLRAGFSPDTCSFWSPTSQKTPLVVLNLFRL